VADLTAHAHGCRRSVQQHDWDAARRLIGNSTYNDLGTQRSLDGADVIDALKGLEGRDAGRGGHGDQWRESGQQVVLE
jgi:hypothetical protein